MAIQNVFVMGAGVMGSGIAQVVAESGYSVTLMDIKEEFINKAVAESKKGKLCVMLIPVSTSTKIFHEVIQPNAKEIRFVRGRIPFIGINTRGEYVNWHLSDNEAPSGSIHVKNSGMHDSMVVVFESIGG